MEPIDALRAFRDSLYRCFDRRADALFELGDVLLTAGEVVPSPVNLSLEPWHRRGWGSLYAALERGRIDAAEALRKLLARHPLAAAATTEGEPPVYAPVVDGRGRAVPLFVFDAGYDPVQVQQGLEGCRGQILVRLRAGRCFYADPSGPPAATDRSRRHGEKFDCKDPASLLEISAEHVCEDARYGTVRVRAWVGLHPKVQVHAGRGTRGPTPIVRGTLVLVEVERLPRSERRREPRLLWLWWHGPDEAAPDLGLLWRAYARRFDLEHTFRFLKQTLR